MAVLGFSDSKFNNPEMSWWAAQVRNGNDFRKKNTFQDQWPTWRRYYRGEWDSGVIPVNLFFTMVNTIVPRIYFRNPTVSLAPGVPGLEYQIFARVLQRMDNKLLRLMDVKSMMKRMVRDAFMFGTGVGKLGFGGIYSPGISPYLSAPGKERMEYGLGDPALPWFRRVPTGDFVVPLNTAYLDDNVRWNATRVVRPLSDVQSDERFNNSRKDVRAMSWEGQTGLDGERVEMCELYEIQDFKTGRVLVCSLDTPESSNMQRGGMCLYNEPDPMQDMRTPKLFPLIFNEQDDVFWGVPDSQILWPYQLEINETRTQIMKFRRALMVRILVSIAGMAPEEAEKMFEEDSPAILFTKKDPRTVAQMMQTSTIPPELVQHLQTIMMDVRQTVGFSRNEMGEFASRSGDTTATEANIVREGVEIRVDERRDACADLLVNMVQSLHQILYVTLNETQVVDMIGPGGQILWVQFKKDLIRTGRFAVTIDPDSTQPQTQQLREQKALQFYEVLKLNPFVDPMKLTQYLLSELGGTQFDDLMKVTPMMGTVPPEGLDPSQGMTMDQFGQFAGQNMQAAAQAGAPPANAA